MVATSGEEFDFLGGLAASQGEFHETSVGKISFIENKLAGRGAAGLGPLLLVDGAISFCDSHVALLGGNVVRAAFGA